MIVRSHGHSSSTYLRPFPPFTLLISTYLFDQSSVHRHPIVAPPDPVRVHSLHVFTVPILCHIHRLYHELVSSESPRLNRCYSLPLGSTSRQALSTPPPPHSYRMIVDYRSTINSRSAALVYRWMNARLLLRPQSVLLLDHTPHANTKVVQSTSH